MFAATSARRDLLHRYPALSALAVAKPYPATAASAATLFLICPYDLAKILLLLFGPLKNAVLQTLIILVLLCCQSQSQYLVFL